MNNSPIACTLSPGQLRCCADELLPGLARLARSVTRTANGAHLEFESTAGIVLRIATVVERERHCCQFLHFTLDVPQAFGIVTLRISGPEGSGEFLEALAPEFQTVKRATPD